MQRSETVKSLCVNVLNPVAVEVDGTKIRRSGEGVRLDYLQHWVVDDLNKPQIVGVGESIRVDSRQTAHDLESSHKRKSREELADDEGNVGEQNRNPLNVVVVVSVDMAAGYDDVPALVLLYDDSNHLTSVQAIGHEEAACKVNILSGGR